MTPLKNILIPLCILLACHSALAEQFTNKRLRFDTRIEESLVNSAQTALPLLKKDETFQVEIFIEGARSLRTNGYTIAFYNDGNRFGDNFAISHATGILPQEERPGPTSITANANGSVIISNNDYLATVTLAVKRDLPQGLTLRLDPVRTRIIDAKALTADVLDVSNTVITFGKPNFDLFLDVDTAPGNQGLTETFGINSDSEIAIEIFGNRIRFMSGFILRFEYDATQIEFDVFEPSTLLPNVQTLDPIITQLDSPFADVEVTAASFGGSADAENGLLGTLRFKPLEAFSRSGVRMTLAEIRRSGAFRPYFAPLFVDLIGLNTDFDGDGFTGFRDFVLFAERFGAKVGSSLYSDRFDLVPDGQINFADFIVFSESFTILNVTVIN